MLCIYLLGSTRVSSDGVDITNRIRPKSLGLLKLLAHARRRPVSREMLTEILWPDSPPAAAFGSLKVAAHNLRRSLGMSSPDSTDWMMTHRGAYRLGASVWIDADQFERHIRTAKAHQAVGETVHARESFAAAAALYLGDYLEDDPYEDWPTLTRERLRDQYLYALGWLAVRAVEDHDYQRAIDYSHQIVQFDPCREDVYQLLMVSHCALGQLSRAVAWYAAAARMVRRELDAEVSQQTRKTFLRLLDGLAGSAGGAHLPDPKSFAALIERLDVDSSRAVGQRVG